MILIGTGMHCPQSDMAPSGYYVCPNCGAVVPITSHCGSWLCPVCWRIAAHRAVKSIVSRFRDQIQSGNMQHWVLSPPAGRIRPEQDPAEAYESIARMIRRDMPEMAGVAILHPYRVRVVPDDNTVLHTRLTMHVSRRRLGGLDIDVDDVSFDALSVSEDVELYHGTWAALLQRPDWEEYVYYSPHIHFVACGYMLPSTQRRLRERGWIVKRVRRLVDADNVERVLMYLWSHSVYTGKHRKQYRVCIGRRWRLRRLHVVVRADYVVCPSCGGYMRRVDAGYKGWISDLSPVIRRCREVIWRLELR